MGKKRRILSYIIFFTFLVLIILTLSIVSYLNALYKEQYLERRNHINLLTDEVAETIDLYIDNLWRQIATTEILINEANANEENNLKSVLGHAEYLLTINANELFALTADGEVIGAVQSNNDWYFDNDKYLLSSLPQKQSFIYQADTLTEEYIIFLYRLNQAISFNHQTITHLFIARKMSTLQEFFRSKAYETKMSSIIIDKVGNRKYSDICIDEAFLKTDNILTALSNKKYKFYYEGSIEKLNEIIENRINYTFMVKGDNGKYFVSFSKLSFDNWNLAIVINTNDVRVRDRNELFESDYFKISLMIFAVLVFVSLFAISLLFYVSTKEFITEKKNNQKLQELNQKAVGANNAKTAFISRLSHDIRTPINGVIGMTFIAKENIDDKKKVLDCLDKISNASDSLLVLVNDVLDLSKLESGKIYLNYNDINLKSFLEQTALLASNNLVKRDLNFKTSFNVPNDLRVTTSEIHLRQILLNLLSNAIKYTYDGGSIFFEVYIVENKDDNATIEGHFLIKDTGIGMSSDFIKRLYDSYEREESSLSKNIYGSGLGMNIVKSLIDKMNGTIEVSSELNVGTSFFVTLPLRKSTETTVVQKNFEVPDELRNMNILLVEDNSINAEIAINILEKAHFNVILAHNGLDALKCFKESAVGFFDIILMDIQMPVMNGYEATKKIRESNRDDSKITIIAMSANAFKEDVEASIKAGMDAHISKPIDPKRLVNKLLELKH